MVTVTEALTIYTIGGLTFFPLLVGCVLLHAHWTFPHRDGSGPRSTNRSRHASEVHAASREVLKEELEKLPEELRPRTHEPDVAAGYFAVYRDFVLGWMPSKPLEKTATMNGHSGLPSESPSVYQSMYRSIFDRGKHSPPKMESSGKRSSNNVFFVVLRHGHLMLYDNAEQLEVRHVISLAYHDVDIYGGDEIIPEGELFVKRNCLRLRRKRLIGDTTPGSKPFYLYTDNCSMKEDFYYSLLQSQDHDDPPVPLGFDPADIVRLVQRLHASEEHLQTRWFNAVVGRIFLSMYRTQFIENFIRMKVTKKIARVQKPAFVTSITVQHIDMGNSAPMITNPKLKELTVDGQLTCEADLSYHGNFRIEIGAVLRIDLGQRFKPREVNVVLASIFESIEGHILMRIKPPPTNRIWFSFETMPKLGLTVEPIVSSRQITYGFILRTIENRIREVFAETLVQPNWDDTPFFDTVEQNCRAGIWVNHQAAPSPEMEMHTGGDHNGGSEDEGVTLPFSAQTDEKAMSMPHLLDSVPITQRGPRKSRTSVSLDSTTDITKAAQGISSAIDTSSSSRAEVAAPRAIRSRSFASAADPVVSADQAIPESLSATPTPPVQVRRKLLGGKKDKAELKDAASTMKDISARSMSTPAMVNDPALESPLAIPAESSVVAGRSKGNSVGSASSKDSNGLESGQVETASPSVADDASRDARSDSVSSLAAAMRHNHSKTHSIDSTRSIGEDTHSVASEVSIASDDAPRSPKISRSGTSLTDKHNHRTAFAAARSALTDPEKRQNMQASVNAAMEGAKKWGLGVLQRQATARANKHHRATGSRDDGRGRPESASSVGAQEEVVDANGDYLASEPSNVEGESSAARSQLGSPSLNPETIGTSDRPTRKRNVSSGHVDAIPTYLSKTVPLPGAPGSPGAPMGRGRPLPPPGVPLPGPEPERQTWVGTLVGLRRKKVPGGPESPGLSPRPAMEVPGEEDSTSGSVSTPSPPGPEPVDDCKDQIEPTKDAVEEHKDPVKSLPQSPERAEEAPELTSAEGPRVLSKQASRASLAEPSKPVRRIPVPILNTSTTPTSERTAQVQTPRSTTPTARPTLSKRHSSSTLSPDTYRSNIPLFSEIAEEATKTPPSSQSRRQISPGGSRIPLSISRSSSTDSRRTSRTISPRPSSMMLDDSRVNRWSMTEDSKEAREQLAEMQARRKDTDKDASAAEGMGNKTTSSSTGQAETTDASLEDLIPEPLSLHRQPDLKPSPPPRNPNRSSTDLSSEASTTYEPLLVDGLSKLPRSGIPKPNVSPISIADTIPGSAIFSQSDDDRPEPETETSIPPAAEPSPIAVAGVERVSKLPTKRRPVPKPPLPKRHEEHTLPDEDKEKLTAGGDLDNPAVGITK